MRIKSKEDGVKENDKKGLDLTEQDVDVHEAESVAKAGSPSRVPWSTVAVDEMRRLFHDEILEKSLSLASVKEKITGSKILKTEDPKCVYDRVWAEWRFPSSDDKPEREEMKERFDRMFREDVPSEDFTSDIVPPTSISSRAKAFFSQDHVRTLLHLFEDMMRNVPISKNEILTWLSNDVEGKDIISVLLVSQVLNRIKYERRQRRAKVH